MELDKRIIEGKKPLNCFDVKEAKQFIDKKGFFGARESQFMNLDTCPKCVVEELKEVDNYDESPFITSGNHCYRFFLPEEWVKEREKKYRAFTLDEWIEQHEIGDVIHYRSKSEMIEAHIMYMGTYHHKNKGTIVLGVASYTLDCLFEEFEIEVNGKWQPFGVLDEEDE